jgi:hypothetical protein
VAPGDQAVRRRNSAADHPDHEFVFGLERILDGIEALVRARG